MVGIDDRRNQNEGSGYLTFIMVPSLLDVVCLLLFKTNRKAGDRQGSRLVGDR